MDLPLLIGVYSVFCSLLCGVCYAPGVVNPPEPSQSPESELSHLSKDGVPPIGGDLSHSSNDGMQSLGGVHKSSAEDMDNTVPEHSVHNSPSDPDNSFDVLLLTPYWNMAMAVGESLTVDCGVYTEGQEVIIQWWKNKHALDSKADSDDRYKHSRGERQPMPFCGFLFLWKWWADRLKIF